jgi:O-antigen/teichoic acid export membrane protein
MRTETATKAVKNVILSGMRLLAGMIAAVCTSAIMARKLGPENMGIYSYGMWLVGTLGTVANCGIPAALTKFVSEYIGNGDTGTAVRVGKRLLLVQLVLAMCIALGTASFMGLKTPYRGVIGLAAVMLFAQALQQSLGAVLAGVQRFDRLAVISFYVALASVAAVAVAAFLNAGVIGMLWATLVGLAVSIWWSYTAANKYLLQLGPGRSRPLRATPEIFHRVRKFSFTISYVLLIDAIVWQRSEVLFLKRYSALAEIGFYTLAYSIASKLSDVANTFATTLLPLFSETYGRSGMGETSTVVVNGLKYVQMVMVPLCLVGVGMAKPVVYLLYGSRFGQAAIPLQILLISLSITCMGVVISPFLLATEQQGVIARYGTAVAILNILLDVILIPKYAAIGAAVANSTAQVAGVLGGLIYSSRYSRFCFPWRTSFSVFTAAAISMVFGVEVNRGLPQGMVSQIGVCVIAGLIYLGILVVFGELGRRDVGVVKDLFSKLFASERLGTTDLA